MVSVGAAVGALAAISAPAFGQDQTGPNWHHPAVVLAQQAPSAFDYAATAYSHPAGGYSAAPTKPSIHVRGDVRNEDAAAMLRVASEYRARRAASQYAPALSHLTTRVVANYVIPNKVVSELQLTGQLPNKQIAAARNGALLTETRMEIYEIVQGKVTKTWSASSAPSIEQQLARTALDETRLAE